MVPHFFRSRQQKLATGFAKRPTLYSSPGMIDAIAIQVVCSTNKTLEPG